MTGELHWRDVSTAFLPEAPVTDPRGLIARREEVRRLLEALSRENAVPVVTGPPGIGKTSVLNITRGILVGFEEGLADLDLTFYAPVDLPRLVVWIRCEHELADGEDLARRILDYLRTATEVVPSEPAYRVREFSVEGTLSLATLKAAWERRSGESRGAVDSLSALLSQYSRDANAEVVLMLDECEHLTWLPDLFGFVRRFDESGIRFVLALREGAIYRLRSGPYGDYRWPDEIDVGRLGSAAVDEFFVQACARLNDLGVRLLIAPSVIGGIAARSAGEPWYLQMIGAEMLSERMASIGRAGTKEAVTLRVDYNHFESAEGSLVDRRLRGMYGEVYNSIAAHAPRREELLQCLAAYPRTTIPDQFIRFISQKRLAQADRIVQRLASWSPIPILIRTKAPLPGVEFESHQFRVYCRVGTVLSVESRLMATQLVQSWQDLA